MRKKRRFESGRSKLFLILAIFGAFAALSNIAPPILRMMDALNRNPTFNLIGTTILFATTLSIVAVMLVFAFANRRRGRR